MANLSVEGLNKSAIARVERIGWNTVDRWLEKASDCSRCFNDKETTGFQVTELQADEIRTIIQGKQQPTWIFATIEVWSRLWSSTVVGRRSYHPAGRHDAKSDTQHVDQSILSTQNDIS